jgi:SPP1 family predicted phage head-tail adaptor
MRAGDLRRRVTIQTRDTSRDTYGQQVTTWTDYMTGVPAAIEPLSGRELVAAQAVFTEVTHLVRVRYSDMLSDPKKVAAMRVVYQNGGTTRNFNIGASENVEERNREMHLFTSEGVNNG